MEYRGLYDDSADRYYAADIETVIDTKALLEESGGFTIHRLNLPELGACRSFEWGDGNVLIVFSGR